MPDFGVRRQNGERLAVLTSCHPHGPEFRRKMLRLRPPHEGRFNFIVETFIGREHLQARTRTDGVVGEHLN